MANVFKTLATIDRKIYYAILLVILIYGSTFPIAVPIEISHWTQEFYDKIDNEIQPGDILLVHFGLGPGVRMTMWSAYTLSLWQVLHKRPRIIWVTTVPQAFPVKDMILNDPLVKAAMEEENLA